jgi:hypothetical protein
VLPAGRGGESTVSPNRCQTQSWAARLVGHLWRPQQPDSALTPEALDFTRRLLSETLEWYRNADLKSQILLTLDGAFLAFLTASAFKVPKDLKPIVARFGPETWLFLGLMTLALSGSIGCALLSLRSRGVFQRPDGLNDKASTLEEKPAAAKMWFFEDIRRLNQEKFQRALSTVDQAFEIEAIGTSVFILASNVSKKHMWVNVGFVLAGVTLLLFLGATVSYFVRIVG